MANFFEESREQSEVKSAIVTKYFWAWARVIIPQAKKQGDRIAYIDLFAGPGRYKDGTKSTPLLLLEKATEDLDMCRMLVTFFNDVNADHSRSLESAIGELPGIEKLQHKPRVYHFEVGDQIVKEFRSRRLVPTLFFVDPWGYKGLSLDLVGSVLKDWGSDCIFFFNYNRINMGLTNDLVRDHMNALFGSERAERLRQSLEPLNPFEREMTIVEELVEALHDLGGTYVLPFTFKNEAGSRTSHHLIFVSKAVRGYSIMKDIMAAECSHHEQGVPTFQYNPADKRFPRLFELSRPLDCLVDMLLQDFAGQTLKMQDIYEQHHVGKPYVKRNYKDALLKLETEGRIRTNPAAKSRRMRYGVPTFADTVLVFFPPQS